MDPRYRDDSVTGITDLVLAAVDIAVSVKVLELDIARIDGIGLGCLHDRVIVLLAGFLNLDHGRIDVSLVLPEAVGDEAPEFTDPHSLIVVTGK